MRPSTTIGTTKRRGGRRQRGVTLVELMIGVAVLSITAASTAITYSMLMKALSVSKSRGIASRLALDKFETLGSIPYSQLMVTEQGDLNISPGVDLTYYPPESFNMGGKIYTRSTIVSRVYKDGSGNVQVLAPASADTGMKQIKVLVNYTQGTANQTYTGSLLVTDPNLTPLNGLLYGVVTDTGGVAIANARVFITQNQNWFTVSSSTGYYQISTDTGSYTATAIKQGYFDLQCATVTLTTPVRQDFSLTPRAKGKITGIATARPPFPLISAVYNGLQTTFSCGSIGGLGGTGSDFLELYNPTTAPYLITTGGGPGSQIQITFTNYSGNTSLVALSWGDSLSHSIPAQGYYLIASDSPTINCVVPDAIMGRSVFQHNHGGVSLQTSYGIYLDTVGWSNDGALPSNANAYETTPLKVPGDGSNWWRDGNNAAIIRISTTAGVVSGFGNSFDGNNNSNDLQYYSSLPAGHPLNSLSTATVVYGIPAASAAVAALDGFSPGTTASSTGYYLLTSVTTGYWSVSAYWSSYSTITVDNLQVVTTTGTITRNLLLESSGSGIGGVSGQVLDATTLQPLSGIIISAGTKSTQTDPLGNYVINLSSGQQTIKANDGFPAWQYNSLLTTAAVNASSMTFGVNFNLVASGEVTGKVYMANGTTPYPNIPVHAISQGLEVATDMTDAQGNYQMFGVPVGNTAVSPVLDPQSQSSNPTSTSLSITQNIFNNNNFTITSGMGTISGSVTSGGQPVLTGVLVIASTAAFTDPTAPPSVNNAAPTFANVLFATISDSAGNYSMKVLLNSTYTVYGYYTSLYNSSGINTVAKNTPNVYVSSTSKVNFQW